jgi:hypothetical protein
MVLKLRTIPAAQSQEKRELILPWATPPETFYKLYDDTKQWITYFFCLLKRQETPEDIDQQLKPSPINFPQSECFLPP